MINEMDEEDEEQYYDDAMFEEEGPTAVELAQRIIKEFCIYIFWMPFRHGIGISSRIVEL